MQTKLVAQDQRGHQKQTLWEYDYYDLQIVHSFIKRIFERLKEYILPFGFRNNKIFC
jgi:hypothetical protein